MEKLLLVYRKCDTSIPHNKRDIFKIIKGFGPYNESIKLFLNGGNKAIYFEVNHIQESCGKYGSAYKSLTSVNCRDMIRGRNQRELDPIFKRARSTE